MKKTTFKVKKYECASCAMVMEGICEDTNGVSKAAVNPAKMTLTIEHEETLELSVLKNALEKEGYPVEIEQA